MTTVAPAKSTAWPAVALARPAASRHASCPSCEVLAVAGDDEQRVVDADAEADHRRRASARRSGMSTAPARTPTPDEADDEAEQRGADRDAHGDHRAERDEQHDDRDAEADAPRCCRPPRPPGRWCRRSRPGCRRHGRLIASAPLVVVLGLQRWSRRTACREAPSCRRRSAWMAPVERVADVRDASASAAGDRGLRRSGRGRRGSSRLPSSTWNTTRPVAPAWAGNRSSRRSKARWDSTPGTTKSLFISPPAAAATRRWPRPGPSRPPGPERVACTRRRFGTGTMSREPPRSQQRRSHGAAATTQPAGPACPGPDPRSCGRCQARSEPCSPRTHAGPMSPPPPFAAWKTAHRPTPPLGPRAIGRPPPPVGSSVRGPTASRSARTPRWPTARYRLSPSSSSPIGERRFGALRGRRSC